MGSPVTVDPSLSSHKFSNNEVHGDRTGNLAANHWACKQMKRGLELGSSVILKCMLKILYWYKWENI